MEYRAVIKNDSSSELTHWKYIKRVKGKNGKWKYIYDDSTLKKHEKGVEETDEYGNTTQYGKTARLLDKEFKIGDTTVKNQGDLSRAIAKGEKLVYDKLIGEDKKTDDKKSTETTANNVNSLPISEKVMDQVQEYGKELAKDLQETSRKFDNVKYNKLDKKYKEDQDAATSLSAYTSSTIKRGSNAAKKILNNIGNGTLDNRVDEMANKAKQEVNKFLRKSKKRLGIN